jgi:hypothetical protein
VYKREFVIFGVVSLTVGNSVFPAGNGFIGHAETFPQLFLRPSGSWRKCARNRPTLMPSMFAVAPFADMITHLLGGNVFPIKRELGIL